MRARFAGIAVLTALGFSSTAAAEFRATVGDWRYDIAGTVTDQGRSYDFQRDLELETSGRRVVLVEWDTGPGWWPDWSASFAQVGAAGQHEETFTLFIGNIPIGSQTETITAFADFDDYDLTARYPFALGAWRMALGLTAKRLRGEVFIDDSAQSSASRQQYDETVPMLHGQLRWPLFKGLVLAAAGQGLSYGGSRAVEWRAAAEMSWLAPLLLEAGWQAKAYELNLDDYALDARVDGAVLRAGFLLR